MSTASGVQISDIGIYLPSQVLTNNELHNNFGFDIAFLENRIGIRERRISSESETASYMSCEAIRRLLLKTGVSIADIDLLVLCTQNPDYRLPTTACLVQESVGLRKDCACFDINLGCSGFVYSLRIAGNFVELGQAKNAVVVTVDQYTKYLDKADRNTVALFGDAAAATLLTPCKSGYGIVGGSWGTDGSGAKHLILENSAVVSKPTGPHTIFMNGKEIFKFVVQVIPQHIHALLERHKVQVEKVRYFVFHQANRHILMELKHRLSLTDEQLVVEMEDVGNTVSSTIPIAYDRLCLRKGVLPGDYIVFCGFGVGLSWGTILYQVP